MKKRRLTFADEKRSLDVVTLEFIWWHNFCIIGLRPSHLRVGCREILKNISTLGKKGA